MISYWPELSWRRDAWKEQEQAGKYKEDRRARVRASRGLRRKRQTNERRHLQREARVGEKQRNTPLSPRQGSSPREHRGRAFATPRALRSLESLFASPLALVPAPLASESSALLSSSVWGIPFRFTWRDHDLRAITPPLPPRLLTSSSMLSPLPLLVLSPRAAHSHLPFPQSHSPPAHPPATAKSEQRMNRLLAALLVVGACAAGLAQGDLLFSSPPKEGKPEHPSLKKYEPLTIDDLSHGIRRRASGNHQRTLTFDAQGR